MRIPDPKANTTTEAYLAYKAGYLEESELKPVLYEPYLHFDAWLAYWAGLTNTYPTDKNDNPEMLCDEEALVAYLAGVTDTYPEEIKDPYDVRIVGYLKYLVSARWGRPEYPVNNEEFYLSTMKPPVVPSGDTPSSDIEMDDTIEAPFIDLKMYGGTRQNSYTGKNLSPYPYYSGSSSVARGITFTAALDGSITMNGSNDGSGNSAYFIYNNDTSPLQFEAGTYYFIPPSDANVGYVIYDGTSYYDLSSANNYSQTFSSAKSIHLIYVQVRRGNTTVFNNLKIYPMLTTLPNQTESDYEPYVGGTPAPNPDYPQDVNVVTGEQTVKVTGKNLLNLNFTSGSSQGVTIVKDKNDIITVTGTSLRTGSISISPASVGSLVLENGETYTQRFEVIDGELPGGVSVVPSFMDSDGNIRYNYFSNNSSVTTESEMTCNTYNFYWNAADIKFNFSFRVWLEKNDDLSSEYSPYQSQSYPISLGSTELCKIGDYQDYIYKSDDEWYIHKEVGKEVNNGTRAVSFRVVTDTINSAEFNFPEIVNHNPQVYSTHFRWVNQDNANAGVHIYTYWGASGIKYYLPNTIATTKEEWQAWLETNPDIFYYPLATYTDTKITDSELISQLDALMEGGSYEDKTFIKVTATDPNLPGLLYVEAGKYD